MASETNFAFNGFTATGTDPQVLTPKTMVGDSGTGGVAGTVPAPASGDAAAGKFLKADGTWAAPAGGGTWGGITGTLSDQTDLQSALDAKLDDSQLDTDGTLAADSDSKIASQKATKTYADTALALKAPLASPALTGNPTAPTQTLGDNSTKIATTAFVTAAVAAVTGSTVHDESLTDGSSNFIFAGGDVVTVVGVPN